MKEEKATQTAAEAEQALSELAEKLDEMDSAEGVFGEAMLDKELEDAAGGMMFTAPNGVKKIDGKTIRII